MKVQILFNIFSIEFIGQSIFVANTNLTIFLTALFYVNISCIWVERTDGGPSCQFPEGYGYRIIEKVEGSNFSRYVFPTSGCFRNARILLRSFNIIVLHWSHTVPRTHFNWFSALHQTTDKKIFKDMQLG